METRAGEVDVGHIVNKQAPMAEKSETEMTSQTGLAVTIAEPRKLSICRKISNEWLGGSACMPSKGISL